MTINSKSENISKDDLLSSAKSMKIKEIDALKIISRVCESLTRWPEYGKKAFIDANEIEDIKKQFIVF